MIIAVAALLAAAQAEPLDPDLACVIDRVPESARATVVEEALSGGGGSARAAFRSATDACARERSWNAEFASGLGRIAMAVVLGEEAEVILRRNGISPDLIHDWFNAQSVAVQQGEPSEEVGGRLIEHLQAQGIPLERLSAHAQTIGILLGALNMIERIGAGLE
ncbi:MAG: hypothetical protein ACK4SZ_11485 [Allosphingosinicella sp.]|uniref:hypothetical protein n=1 Tax=Allosphingosinicella sp. TaxID=2823234 RepID=UPI0039374CF6